MKDDAHMLTASGDQTVRLWDVEVKVGLGIMRGHSGSVKSLSSHPYKSDIFASGSRDGTVALWDLRCSSTQSNANDQCFIPVSVIKDAHIANQRKLRRCKANPKSVTAVLCLKDDRIIATAGAADGIVKFWDIRKLKSPVAQTPPQSHFSDEGKEGRVHGIAGLSQDSTGASIIASCTNSRVYLYSVLRPEEGSLEEFSGHILGSFYIKAAFSPDASHILSGSSDGNVFIWQRKKPESPVVLKGHGGEVTAVDWCLSDFCKIATCSDDFTVRVWSNLEPQFEPNQQSPCVIRRRISAEPYSALAAEAGYDSISPGSPSYRILFKRPSSELNECDNLDTRKDLGKESKVVELCNEQEVVLCESSLEVPGSLGVSKLFKAHDCSEQKSEESLSPSSVLHPPCSLKRRRTIIDYYNAL